MSFVDRASRLTEQEFEALACAGTWYANYFAREIAAEASETAAYAVEERRAYLALVAALRKLGLLYALPDELVEHAAEAA